MQPESASAETTVSGVIPGSAGDASLPGRLLTIGEAAEYLNVPARWMQDAVQQRRVRCTRIGKHVRFTQDHLLELIAAGEQPVTKPPCITSTAPRRSVRRSRL